MSIASLISRVTAPEAIHPDFLEMGAYEALWERQGATFKTVSEQIERAPSGRAAELVAPDLAERNAREVLKRLAQAKVADVGLRLFDTPDYPSKLCDARYPLRAFYYRGDWDLVNTRSVAVVGARQITEEGVARTRRLVRYLVEDGFTIVSGLAAGTDTVAHTTALEMKGRTIAVLGTPITETYPRQNKALQRDIGDRFLVISQVPMLRYASQDYRRNRLFFPERNITMCALTDASIIAAIGQSNGSFIQSKAALDQRRPLFLLNNCFHKEGIDWPHKFAKRGAVRAYEYDDIRSRLMHLIDKREDDNERVP
ncbi:MAG: DNA-processing protein DprA [Alphaproteobacteria bacterium]